MLIQQLSILNANFKKIYNNSREYIKVDQAKNYRRIAKTEAEYLQ